MPHRSDPNRRSIHVSLAPMASALLAFGSPSQVATSQAARSVTQAEPLVAEQIVSPEDWAAIRAARDVTHYGVISVGGQYLARNHGQRWSTAFDGRGVSVRPVIGSWSWGTELVRYGWTGVTRSACLPREVSTDGQRLSYDWDAGLTEWYVNAAGGLEHGYSVHARPEEATGGLHLVIAIRGALRPVIADSGRDVRFFDEHGPVLDYVGLAVFDANGRSLTAGWESRGSELHLFVEDENATYPLTIDPIAQQAYLKASNTGSDDEFGRAVAVSGNTVVVGAREEDGSDTGVNGIENDNGAARAGAAYVFVRNGTNWSQQAYLKASNTNAGDHFGGSVSISGDTIVIGALGEDSLATGVNGDQSNNGGNNCGAAYVFVRSGSTWSQQAYLKASNTQAGDNFGISVSVSGDMVVVGADNEDSSATGVNGDGNDNGASDSGAAYVFVRNGTTWSQQAYLKASNTGGNDQFGWSTSVSGNTVVVGAYFEDSNATGVNGDGDNNGAGNSGAAYVFVRNGTTWSQEAYLKASNTGANDIFGFSVSVSGNTAVASARREDSTANDSGTAYVFVRAGGTWSQQAFLKATNAGAWDEFGWSVAISDNTIVASTILEDSNATGVDGDGANDGASDAGAAYVYVRSGTTWSQAAYLKASNTGMGDAFGRSVAVSGDTVVVGANLEDSNASGVNGDGANNSAGDSGAVYVFLVPSSDSTPPVLYCPPIVTKMDARRSPPGEIVFFSVTAMDDQDPNPSIVCVPPSGSFFPRGTTMVTCTATDTSGNQATCTFPVVVLPSFVQRTL